MKKLPVLNHVSRNKHTGTINSCRRRQQLRNEYIQNSFFFDENTHTYLKISKKIKN